MHGAIRGLKKFFDCFHNLCAAVLVCQRFETTFITRDAIDETAIPQVLDEDVQFGRVVKGKVGVGDERTQLLVVYKDLVVCKGGKFSLSWVGGD